MSPASVTFHMVPGMHPSLHRAIGYLQGNPELDSWDAVKALDETRRRYLLTSMGEWIDGLNKPAKRFHGFPNDADYWMCFVFKVKEKRQGHRFYGYLYNPQPHSNARLQMCVLCIHAMKKEWETDRSELARVETWYSSSAAKEAIRAEFPDEDRNEQKGRQRQWKN